MLGSELDAIPTISLSLRLERLACGQDELLCGSRVSRKRPLERDSLEAENRGGPLKACGTTTVDPRVQLLCPIGRLVVALLVSFPVIEPAGADCSEDINACPALLPVAPMRKVAAPTHDVSEGRLAPRDGHDFVPRSQDPGTDER